MVRRTILDFNRKVMPRRVIWLLLLITLVKGIAWSIIIPPWHAPDEITHFTYAQLIERFHVFHPDPGQWVNEEIGASWQIAQIHPVRGDQTKILDLSDRVGIAAQIQRLNDTAVKYNYVYDNGIYFPFYRDFTYIHPPLYYLLQAAIQGMFENASIFVRILLGRWLSALFGVLAVAITFRTGQIVWQNDAWALLLATLVSFQPMFSFSMAILNNGSLEIVMFSWCLLIALRSMQLGLSTQRAVTLGIILSIGLWTRISLLIFFPVLFVIVLRQVLQMTRERKIEWSTLARWAIVMILPVFLSGWWYQSGVTSGSNSSLGQFSRPSDNNVSWVNFLIHYDWFNIFRPVLDMYWGDFGWLDAPLPQPILQLLTWVTMITIWTTAWWLMRRHFSLESTNGVKTFAVLLLGLCTLFLVVFYTYLDLRLFDAFGERFGMQGRYFLPPIVGQMIWLAIGLISPAPLRLRRAWMWLVALGMIALNLFSLFSVIALRYYGARNLLLLADRASVLQPTSADTTLSICIAFIVLTGALVLVLFPAFKNSAEAI